MEALCSDPFSVLTTVLVTSLVLYCVLNWNMERLGPNLIQTGCMSHLEKCLPNTSFRFPHPAESYSVDMNE